MAINARGALVLATRAPWSTYRPISLSELRALREALPIPAPQPRRFRLPSAPVKAPSDDVATVVDARPAALASEDAGFAWVELPEAALNVPSTEGWATGKWPQAAYAARDVSGVYLIPTI